MAKQKLTDVMNHLLMLIQSGYPVIYIVSHEEARVLDYLAKIVRVIKRDNPAKNLMRWSEGIGFEQLMNLENADIPNSQQVEWLSLSGIPDGATWRNMAGNNDAGSCLRNVRDAKTGTFPALCDALVVFHDLHPYLMNTQIFAAGGSQVRMIRNTADELRRYYDENRTTPERRYKTVVIVAPTAEGLSLELERDLIVVQFPLPETDELRAQLDIMVNTRNLLSLPQTGPEWTEGRKNRLCAMIAGAGRGLTLEDYKRGLNIFAVRGQELHEDHVKDMLDLKAKAINNRALQYTPHVNIELGGLETIKEWIRLRRDAAINEEVRKKYSLPALKGVMLCGASGGGKSQLAKLIAKEFNLALLRLDIGALFGSYVGESEQRTREALMLAEILAPVVLWIDEIDKAFKGIGGGGDNGVSSRVLGTFLTWLAEKDDDVFVVTTANDFRGLFARFPEFSRKGRFDDIFWVGLPDLRAREEIFRIYLEPHREHGNFQVTDEDVERLALQYNVTPPAGGNAYERFYSFLADDLISTRMTGAEIEHSIKEALFTAYAGRAGEEAPLTPEVVIQSVKAVAARQLYLPGSNFGNELDRLETDARSMGWPFAGN
ncbi:MAG TPA: AAA family ATPase [Bacillota bacterium]|nr:AAA family ATPase [Bacillota bacterium]